MNIHTKGIFFFGMAAGALLTAALANIQLWAERRNAATSRIAGGKLPGRSKRCADLMQQALKISGAVIEVWENNTHDQYVVWDYTRAGSPSERKLFASASYLAVFDYLNGLADGLSLSRVEDDYVCTERKRREKACELSEQILASNGVFADP